MIAEHKKMMHQERVKLSSLTDKMSRLTNRKTPQNPKLLLNELTTGDKNVTFSGKTINNHSTTKTTSSEGKKASGPKNLSLSHYSHAGGLELVVTLKTSH